MKLKIPENKYLGTLCKRGHDYEGTGKSLRYIIGHECMKCKITKTKIRRENNYEEALRKGRDTHKRNKIKNNITRKKYADKNRESINSKRRIYYLKNEKLTAKTYYYNNRDKINKRLRKYRHNLNDAYVASIVTRHTSLKNKDIPKSFIEAYRSFLLLKRYLKKIKGGD